MRIALFADVHGNIVALESVIADGRRQGVDRWLCLGDMAFKGPAPGECLGLVRSLGPGAAILGNTEEWLPDGPGSTEGADAPERAAVRTWWEWTIQRIAPAEVAWLRTLPPSLSLAAGPERLFATHATARGFEDRLPPDAPAAAIQAAFPLTGHSLVACAHMHTPYFRRVSGATVFNVGSVGRPVDGDPRSSYVILETPDGAGEPHANAAAPSIQFRRLAYDVDAAARLARGRGFPRAADFEAALRRGVTF
jgi:diadenosine tetraphosphatase ApaH/serine/threonine PP2A family protein phosphatase